PADYGLSGASELDRWRQQITLRASGILVDSGDREGQLDPDDQIEFVDPATTHLIAIKVSDLREDFTRTIRYGLATASAAERYASSATTMRFIGDHGDEVNPDFWSIPRAQTPRGLQTSWQLVPGHTPAEAIEDCFGPHAEMYATECAHGRTLLRMKGLLDF